MILSKKKIPIDMKISLKWEVTDMIIITLTMVENKEHIIDFNRDIKRKRKKQLITILEYIIIKFNYANSNKFYLLNLYFNLNKNLILIYILYFCMDSLS